jgi:hypothetical protein
MTCGGQDRTHFKSFNTLDVTKSRTQKTGKLMPVLAFEKYRLYLSQPLPNEVLSHKTHTATR